MRIWSIDRNGAGKKPNPLLYEIRQHLRYPQRRPDRPPRRRRVCRYTLAISSDMTSAQLSVVFFLQMSFILAFCQAVGRAGRRWGQPQVVGEMVAGVFMGPSLFGLLWPGAQAFLFPPASLNTLYVFAQLGIGLYMFLVGVEFDRGLF